MLLKHRLTVWKMTIRTAIKLWYPYSPVGATSLYVVLIYFTRCRRHCFIDFGAFILLLRRILSFFLYLFVQNKTHIVHAVGKTYCLNFLQRGAVCKCSLCTVSVCLSVHLSVCHVRVLYPDGWRYRQTSASARQPHYSSFFLIRAPQGLNGFLTFKLWVFAHSW